MTDKEATMIAFHLSHFIGLFGIPGVLQMDNRTEFKDWCEQIIKLHGIPCVQSKPHTPQTNGLIE